MEDERLKSNQHNTIDPRFTDRAVINPLIIYHGGGCMDGFASAWAAHLWFGDLAEYRAMNYGDTLLMPDVYGRDVYIVDFSFKPEVMVQLAANARYVTLLDHHKTAAELVNLEMPGNVFMNFDMNKSGAVLAWEYFHHSDEVPDLIKYVQDRDLWQWKLPESEVFSAGLASFPQRFDKWPWNKMLDLVGINHIKDAGTSIERYRRQQIEAIKKGAQVQFFRMPNGPIYTVPVVNCAGPFISEVVGELSEGFPFAAGWFVVESEDKVIVSLRSRDEGLDVSIIAKALGGGGHARAAGFERALEPGAPGLVSRGITGVE